MEFNPNLFNTKGRVLPMETIVQGSPDKEIRYESGHQVDWTMNLRCATQKKFVPHLLTTIFIAANEHLVLRHFDRWVVIVPFNMEREAMNFISQIMRAASGMKINMCDPYIHKIRDDNMGNYINAIDEVLSRQLPDILICMVNNNRSDRYSAIKKKCCVERSGIYSIIYLN